MPRGTTRSALNLPQKPLAPRMKLTGCAERCQVGSVRCVSVRCLFAETVRFNPVGLKAAGLATRPRLGAGEAERDAGTDLGVACTGRVARDLANAKPEY